MKSLLLLAAIVLGVSGHGHRVHRHPAVRAQTMHLPFYRITHRGSRDTSYIFGTLHLLEGSYVDTLPNVMAALSRSDLMIGELALDSGFTMDALSGLFDAPPLDSLLKPTDYDLVSAAVKKYSPVPLLVLNRAEPVVIYTMLLEGMYAKEHPEHQKTGVPMDLYFQQQAKPHGIRVMGFEEASDQEQALDSIPLKEQTEDLVDLVRHPEETISEMNTMLADYRAGRITEILRNPSFGSFSPGEMSTLLYDRNRKWLNQLQTVLKKQNAFIAVGAGHLAGLHGLVRGLQWLGYTVTWVPAS